MPKEIQNLAKDFLDNYVFLSFGMVGSVTTLVEQNFEQVEQHEKLEKLVETLQGIGNERVLVFTAMKRTADELEWRLRDENVGKVIAIHGDKSQRDRERALNGFRKGRFSVMVTILSHKIILSIIDKFLLISLSSSSSFVLFQSWNNYSRNAQKLYLSP